MASVIMITGRLSFPSLITPQSSSPGSTPRFGCDIILEPNSPDLAKFMALVNELAVVAWEGLAPQVLQMISTDRKLRCYGSGDERTNSKTMITYDGYVGKFYVTALNYDQPQAIGGDGNPIDPVNTMALMAELKKMYGGCEVSVAINPWIQDNANGRAVRCKLVAIQFLRDGVPFGEGPPDLTGMFGQVQGQPGIPAGMPPVAVPPAYVPPAAVPPVGMPPVGMPPVGMPSTAVPPAYVPPAYVPPAYVPPAAVPPAYVPPAPDPSAINPATGLPYFMG